MNLINFNYFLYGSDWLAAINHNHQSSEQKSLIILSHETYSYTASALFIYAICCLYVNVQVLDVSLITDVQMVCFNVSITLHYVFSIQCRLYAAGRLTVP